tara:strand:+ start:87 stop:230 length:144 start_codon:yes stop_codon:yes gene_type:complete
MGISSLLLALIVLVSVIFLVAFGLSSMKMDNDGIFGLDDEKASRLDS